ncbi:MAG: site-specific integrase, partial [Rhodospirillaceae bacterium]|nr:site-specific integrase [Rhodospirillaceae bacterium]
MGSWRTPVRRVLANELRAYRQFVNSRLRLRIGSPDAHNHYAAYTFLLLSMATGIRPVRQPFETFDDFCEETGVFYLQDKDTGGTESPRYVVGADFGIKQLDYYRSYLSRLIMHLEDEGQCHYIEGALNGDAPFLFTLDDDRSVPAPLVPKRVSEILGQRLPMDLYATRHLLRTELVDRGVHDDVVQAFMGHGEMGREPFARYSALSMKDLQFASRKIDEMAIHASAKRNEVSIADSNGENDGSAPAIEPLRYAPLDADRVPLGRDVPVVHRHVAQRDRKRKARLADTVIQRESAEEWVANKINEARDDADRLSDRNEASDWEAEMMEALEKEFPNDKAWRTARELLPKELERLNRERGTAIPIQAAPRYPPRPAPMHNLQTFRAQQSVQHAASRFWRFINDRGRIAELRDEDTVPLVLFSAACFGGLAEPRALFAFGQALRTRSVTLNTLWLPDRPRICWLNLQFETNRSNNLLVDRKPMCMRRFFVDGMTLILLMHYFKRDVPVSKAYRNQNAVVSDIGKSLSRLCGEKLITETKTLNGFCRGAISVTESLPGVELPHYIVEYAAGIIDSVSLPEEYFLAYLGKRSFPGAHPGKTVRLESRSVHGYEPGIDPELDRHIREIRDLFSGLKGVIANRRRAHIVGKLKSLISQTTSENARLLAEYFLHLLERPKRPVQPMTPARYSNWISLAWLLEFEGIDLKSLDEEEWFDKYEAIVEQAAPLARADLACRLMDFHRYLSRHHKLKSVPTDLAGLYRRVRLVRARVVSETQFAGFVGELDKFVEDPEDRACIRWLFTLCFRLGVRIGEASRVRFRDIEKSDHPLIFFRANRFGNTKTRSPHQLRLDRFLTGTEQAEFGEWLTDRGVTNVTEIGELPLFAPAGKPNEVWDTRSLASLFTTVMYEVAGIHYSPHACRHSLASRLLWLAEDEVPPDGNPFDDKSLKRLKDTVFTTAPRCRDRIWHLSAVFNHADPGTTLGSYVHFLDWMLHRKVSANERQIDVDAFFELTALNREEARFSGLKSGKSVRIENAFSLIYPSRKDRFNEIRFRRRSKEAHQRASPPMSQLSIMDRFRYVQPVLQDLEDGMDADEVALRYGQEPNWVRDVNRAASALADVRTARG